MTTTADRTELLTLQGLEGTYLVSCEVVRSARARRMKLVWMPQQYVRLTLPRRCSMKEGTHFLQVNSLWVEKKMREHSKLPSLWGYFKKRMLVSYQGRWLPCELRFEGKQKSVRLEGTGAGKMLVLEHRPVFTERDLDLAGLLIAWARKYLPERVRQMAETKGLCPFRVSVRNQISRWGSCSQRGEISLNWRLVLLPPELQDYVIWHELAHMKVFNHSERFWKLLEQWYPETRVMDRQLRGEEGTRILYLAR